jgi:outer membrane protein assembly factor BamB
VKAASAAALCLASSLALTWASASPATTTENWPHWRGPADNGSTTNGSYAVSWSPSNVLWSASLPGKGCSTPIVWNQQIFLTSPVQDKDAVLSFGWDGKPGWQTALAPAKPGKHNASSANNPSLATDGQGLFACFNSGYLAALNLDGSIRWQTNLAAGFGPESRFFDSGTSPILTESDVIYSRVHQGDSFVAAFDKQTGQLRWKTARNYKTPKEGDQSYATPLLISYEGKPQLLVWGAEHLTAYDPNNGQLLWWCGGFNPSAQEFWPTVASPLRSGNVIIVPAGRSDRGQPRLHGIKLGGQGDVTDTHRIWNRTNTGTFVPTPAEYQGRVYLLRDRGELECLNPATGETFWEAAFPKTGALFYASPTVADGKLYAIREDGTVFVARIGDKFELLSENRMGEKMIASPVPVMGHLLLRGEHHLFCVGSASEAAAK